MYYPDFEFPWTRSIDKEVAINRTRCQTKNKKNNLNLLYSILVNDHPPRQAGNCQNV